MSATRKVYTNEPYKNIQVVRFTDGNRILCDVGYSGTIEGDTANARRIVACWNACEGFETEMLEDVATLGDTILKLFMGMTSEIRRVNAEMAATKAERDALQSKLNSLSTYSGLVNELAEKLAGDGPENFIERTANHPSFGQFTMTLQKTEGITPGGLLAMANLDLAKARALLNEIDGHSGVIISGLALDLLKRIRAFLTGGESEPIPQDDDCLRFKRERDMLLDALWQLANNAAFNEVEVLRSADKDKADILRKRIARAMAVIKVVMGEHWLYPSQRAIIAELRKDGLFVRETVEMTEGNYVTFLKADNCAFELKVKKARAA